MARIDGRAADQLRPVEIIPNINQFAEGSCLIRCGSTHVLCCASVEEGAPRHVPEGEGWVTAELAKTLDKVVICNFQILSHIAKLIFSCFHTHRL